VYVKIIASCKGGTFFRHSVVVMVVLVVAATTAAIVLLVLLLLFLRLDVDAIDGLAYIVKMET